MKGVSLAGMVKLAFTTPEKAKASFAKAKAELQKQGVQFHPFGLHCQPSDSMVQQASLQTICRAALVQTIDLQRFLDDDFKNITTSKDTAAARDYDISGGGWALTTKTYRLTSKVSAQ